LLEELTTFVVRYSDRLWIKGLELLKEKTLNCVRSWHRKPVMMWHCMTLYSVLCCVILWI